MSDANPTSTFPTVVRAVCCAMLLIAGLLAFRQADARLPGYGTWSSPPKTVREKLAIVSTEISKLPAPAPPSDPGYHSREQVLLRARTFVMQDKRERYQAAVSGSRPPAAETADAAARQRMLKKMHDGIRLIKGYRGTDNGFSKHQIEWVHNLPMFVCWYQGKYLGSPAVFYFDVDAGRWVWNIGAAASSKEDQVQYALSGGDPAVGRVEAGPLSSSAKAALVNEILAGLVRINESGR